MYEMALAYVLIAEVISLGLIRRARDLTFLSIKICIVDTYYFRWLLLYYRWLKTVALGYYYFTILYFPAL